jgi:outer membrane protein OmpA-like peptidoglycan-associated protein
VVFCSGQLILIAVSFVEFFGIKSNEYDCYSLYEVLSQARTESVKSYLMGKGIMESRLTAVDFDETKPLPTTKHL